MRYKIFLLDLQANAPGAKGFPALLAHFLLNTGFQTVALYRLARWLSKWGVTGIVLSKLVHKMSIDMSSCHVSPAAEIGAGLRLPHATGIVIGIGARIGERVTIYQNVTIGTREGGGDSYPTIGNQVVIYAGAVIVGGLKIGDGAVIGANSVVLSDVPAGAVAVGAPARATNEGTVA